MNINDWIDAAHDRADAATDGPWHWRNTQEVYLLGERSRVVMAFERMGMQGAQPSFRRDDGLLCPAGKDNLNAIPDAVFIAAARTDLPKALDALRAVLSEVSAWHGDAYGQQVIRGAIADALEVTA